MTDKPFSAHNHNLPPCSLSAHCLRLVNDLDGYDRAYWLDGDVLGEDSGDMLLAEELRAHMEYCPTCSEAVAQARRVRSQQRSALRALLAEGERRVPPTTEPILAVIRTEPALAAIRTTKAQEHRQRRIRPACVIRPAAKHGRERNQRAARRSRWLQGALALAVATALILASAGLFSHLMLLHSGSASMNAAPRASLAPAAGWSSVVMTFVSGKSLMVVNEDPVTNGGAILASSLANGNVSLDSISHDGYRLLYRIYNGQHNKTTYTFQPQGPGKALYILPGAGGHTVWSPDDRYVFISAPQGVRQVDVRSGAVVRTILPSVPSPDIRFYYGGYLYFVNSQKDIAGVLERVNITSGKVQLVSSCADGRYFSLSPSGSIIYYACAGQNALYAVNADGTHAHVVRNNAGWLIGYAADNSPLMLMNVGARYQIVKLGATPAQDRVLLDGLAPGAAFIAPGSVAVAPYGRALVAGAIYADGHEALWYANLTTGTQRSLAIPDGVQRVALNGWDRLQVPAGGLSQPTGSQPFSDWHGVLIAENDSKIGWTSISNIDAYSGSDVLLTSAKLPAATRVDGVSSDGNDVLYQYSSGGKMTYWKLSRPGGNAPLYTLNDSVAGNAIWLPDSRHILVLAVGEGVMDVDTQTGQSVDIIPLPMSSQSGQQVEIGQLSFYRAGYLYFVGAQGACEDQLCRIQVGAIGAVAHPITFRSSQTSYWLSPDGATIYFANQQGPAGQAGIYAVDSDGTHMRLLRAYPDAVPIGYAADMSLEIMRYINGKFMVVKLGATPQADSVVLADAAPGATTLCSVTNPPGVAPICNSNIALAPLGGMLVLDAGYADGSHEIWSIDLKTGQRLQVAAPPEEPGMQVQLVGWDRIPPPAP